MFSFSKNSIGAVLGGSLMAAVAGPDAAANTNCAGIDLAHQPNIRAAFAACLGGNAQPAAREGDPAEIENRGCRLEYDRSARATRRNCIYVIPEDKSCEEGARASRTGNRWPTRAVGTRRCDFILP